MSGEDDDVWVFAYGSLMWKPGFDPAEVRPAVLYGYHRAMCVEAEYHRGTPEKPGLVLGLDRGGCCRGLALRVAREAWEEVKRYLDAREMPDMTHPFGPVYRPSWLRPRLDGGGSVTAYTFVVRRNHPQYTGRLSEDRAAVLVRQGVGVSGSALDYLRNTVEHLDELGIGDGPLHALLRAV